MLRSSCLLTLLFLGLATTTAANPLGNLQLDKLRSSVNKALSQKNSPEWCADAYMKALSHCPETELLDLLDQLLCADWSNPMFGNSVCLSPCFKTLKDALFMVASTNCNDVVFAPDCETDDQCDAGAICVEGSCAEMCDEMTACECGRDSCIDGRCHSNPVTIGGSLYQIEFMGAETAQAFVFMRMLDSLCEVNSNDEFCVDAMHNFNQTCEGISDLGCCASSWSYCTIIQPQVNWFECSYFPPTEDTCTPGCSLEPSSCYANTISELRDDSECGRLAESGLCWDGSQQSEFVRTYCPYHCNGCNLPDDTCGRDNDAKISQLAATVGHPSITNCWDAVSTAGGCHTIYSSSLHAYCPCTCVRFANM